MRGIVVPKARENGIKVVNNNRLSKYLEQKIIPEGRDAFLSLLEGNKRHIEKRTKHNSDRKYGVAKEFVQNGQKPILTALTCSDSRVKLSRIFDKKDGRIFDVKIAGNIAYDQGVLGSLEYGVAHAHTPLLMVVGHEMCGAVNATCAHKGEVNEGSISFIVKSINNTASRVNYDVDSTILLNIFDTLEQIRKNSNIIYGMEKRGEVSLVAAHYSLSSGNVAILQRE